MLSKNYQILLKSLNVVSAFFKDWKFLTLAIPVAGIILSVNILKPSSSLFPKENITEPLHIAGCAEPLNMQYLVHLMR